MATAAMKALGHGIFYHSKSPPGTKETSTLYHIKSSSSSHSQVDGHVRSSLFALEAQPPPLGQDARHKSNNRKHLGDESLATHNPNMQISDFELIRTIGTGTFARVNLARHSPTSQVVALKILHKSAVIRLRQLTHIQSERLVLSAISHSHFSSTTPSSNSLANGLAHEPSKRGHPFIPALLGTFSTPTSLHMVLEYIPGGELFSHLRRMHRFPTSTARFYAAEIVLILGFLHDSLGVIYRDLKPENLLLDARGHIKLVDFGFAKRVDDKETYTLCGTPEYLAPEIIQTKGHGKGADWWALGILLYELLLGQPPWWDANPIKIYEKIVNAPLEWPTIPGVSSDAKELIEGLLQKQPSRRLGCILGGVGSVMNMAFFAGVQWMDLLEGRGDGPIIPKVEGDLSKSGDQQAVLGINFDEYPDEMEEDEERYTEEMRSKYDKEFEGF